VEELSINDTAAILGWTEGKVRMTDYRAIGKLRQVLDGEDEEVTR